MAVKIGNNDITLKLGSTDVSAAYLGSTLVYSGGTPPTPTRADFEIYDVNGDILTSGYCQDLTDNTLTYFEVTNNFTINYDLMYSAFVGDCVTTIQDATFNGIGLFGIPSFTSITIGCGVTTIGKNAISSCYGLTSINIPSGVTSIGQGAFENCSGLTSITVEATTPPTLGTNVFNNTNNCPIYVPAGSVSAYQSAWSAYTSRIQAIPNS